MKGEPRGFWSETNTNELKRDVARLLQEDAAQKPAVCIWCLPWAGGSGNAEANSLYTTLKSL